MRKFIRMENSYFPKKLYAKLPPILSDVTKPYEERNRDVVLLSSLTALSGVFPKILAIYDSDVVYPHLYTMIVAPAASGKSVMMKSRKLIEPVHKYVQIKGTGLDFTVYVSDEEVIGTATADKEKNQVKNKEFVQPIMTIVPANTSNAEFMRFMSANSNGIVMIESEMDTMGNVLKNDWGNYSDLLRKSFHHENISVSRKIEKLHIEVDEPKLALLMSGTPEQIKGITQSKENGLLSRMLIYSYDEITAFKNVFFNHPTSINEIFEKQGHKVLEIYKKLDGFKKNIVFELTERQQKIFFKFFTKRQEIIVDDEQLSFISNLRRLALIHFRICMTITVCRQADQIKEDSALICDNKDFFIAMRIIDVLISHSLLNYKRLEENNGMSDIDLELLDSIKDSPTFLRAEFVEIGINLGLSERTLGDKLKDWIRKKLIIKKKHGIYYFNDKK